MNCKPELLSSGRLHAFCRFGGGWCVRRIRKHARHFGKLDATASSSSNTFCSTAACYFFHTYVDDAWQHLRSQAVSAPTFSFASPGATSSTSASMTQHRNALGYELRLFPPAQPIDWNEADLRVHVRATDATRGRATVLGVPVDGRVEVATQRGLHACVRTRRCTQVCARSGQACTACMHPDLSPFT